MANNSLTPGQRYVVELVERAREDPAGVVVYFHTNKHGCFAAAKSAATGFQNQFSSIRAKVRRKAELDARGAHGRTDLLFRGPMDDMSCVKTPLPDEGGYVIRIVRSAGIDMVLDVVSGSTGKPLEAYQPDARRYRELTDFLVNTKASTIQGRAIANPLSEADTEWCLAYDRETTLGFYAGLGISMERTNQTPTAKLPDLADMDLSEEDFG